MVGTGHVGLQAGEGEEDVDGGEAALDVELAVKVDLVLDDVAGEVCGKMQPKVSAGTRKRRHRSPTNWEPHKSAVTSPARPATRIMDGMCDVGVCTCTTGTCSAPEPVLERI